MTQTTAFKTPEGEAAYLAVYEDAMKSWPSPYEEREISTRFGVTHVVVTGPEDAPPLVLLHGYFGTLTMWSPNIADFSRDYRVYAIDVMGQPGKSVPNPDEPIRDATEYVAWLSETLDGLNLDRVSLVGLSYGGWLALNFAVGAQERVSKLVLLSPAGSFQPNVRQFNLRGMMLGLFPSHLAMNSFMGWMGFEDTPDETATRRLLDLVYLGMKYFRIPPEIVRIMPRVFSDDELRALHVPVLLLIGEDEVMYDAAKVMSRARGLIPNFEGELVPGCNHDMYASQHRIVNQRVLDFLNDN